MSGLIDVCRLPLRRPAGAGQGLAASAWIEEYRRALAAAARVERLAADLRRASLLKSDYR